jgi:hypothetical protein
MKTSKLATFLLATTMASTTFAQNNIFPTTGNTGVGTTVPNFNLQVHGTTNYTETDKFGASVGYGVTSRIGLTNTTTGTTANDGLLMRMSTTNFKLENKENGGIQLSTGSASISMSGITNRTSIGTGSANSTAEYGSTNIIHNGDNGLFIQTQTSGKYGLSIRSQALTDNAIQVMGTTGATRNFAVKANGEVYARKYTTTLAAIPDYVFQPDYKLMPLAELKQYINTNSHLPNVPSAQEFEQNGVDLGELNRVLLEKVEELTLYILELEERMKNLEEKQ